MLCIDEDDAKFIVEARNVVLALIACVRAAEARADLLKRDGAALVRQFENVSHALNDIHWPSENKLATERACDALRSLAGLSIRHVPRIAELEAGLAEACLGWEDAKHDGPNDEEWVVIRRLRGLAVKR